MTPAIPTHIITGFLGAGKTTTVNHLLAQLRDESVLVVVNEMGQVGIDAALLQHPQSRVLELNGGCMCCALRVLLETRLAAALRRHKPDRIVIEPTGVGHPRDLVQILEHGPLAKALAPGPHVVVCDPALHAREKIRQHPLYADQWQVAQWAAISKAEDSDPGQLARLHTDAQAQGLAIAGGGRASDLRLLSWPPADQHAAVHASTGHYHHHDQHHDQRTLLPGHGYHSYLLHPQVPMCAQQVRQWLQAMAESEADTRIKAVFALGEQMELWQLVAGRIDHQPLPGTASAQAVVIIPDTCPAARVQEIARAYGLSVVQEAVAPAHSHSH